MNKENLKKIMDDFDELISSSIEIDTIYEDEDGKHSGTIEWIDIDDIRTLFCRLEKELEV